MKSKKLMAALSALTLGATMMGGMAMTANATCVKDTTGACAGNGGFYAYYDTDGDNVSEWAEAPHGMYDGNIVPGTAVVTTVNGVTYVTFDVQEATYQFTSMYSATGNIEDITDSNGVSAFTDEDTVTMIVGAEYDLTIDVAVTSNYHSQQTSPIKFVISACDCGNCNC